MMDKVGIILAILTVVLVVYLRAIRIKKAVKVLRKIEKTLYVSMYGSILISAIYLCSIHFSYKITLDMIANKLLPIWLFGFLFIGLLAILLPERLIEEYLFGKTRVITNKVEGFVVLFMNDKYMQFYKKSEYRSTILKHELIGGYWTGKYNIDYDNKVVLLAYTPGIETNTKVFNTFEEAYFEASRVLHNLLDDSISGFVVEEITKQYVEGADKEKVKREFVENFFLL